MYYDIFNNIFCIRKYEKFLIEYTYLKLNSLFGNLIEIEVKNKQNSYLWFSTSNKYYFNKISISDPSAKIFNMKNFLCELLFYLQKFFC